MYYFYILQSVKNKKLYLGYTSDLKTRLKKHNSGSERATKPNVPYELVYYSAFKVKKDALACEEYHKTTSGWRRLKKMLKSSITP